MACDLSEHHQHQLVNYLRFAKYQRSEQVRDAQINFKNMKSQLFDSTYTKSEVIKMLDELCRDIKMDTENELTHVAHTNVLLLQQMMTEAEKWHLKLDADVADLENKKKMEMISKFEEDYVVQRKKVKSIALTNDSGPAALLRKEIDRLSAELGSTTNKLKKSEALVKAAEDGRAAAARHLQELQKRVLELEPSLQRRLKELFDASVDSKSLTKQMKDMKVHADSEIAASGKQLDGANQEIASMKHNLLEVSRELERTKMDDKRKRFLDDNDPRNSSNPSAKRIKENAPSMPVPAAGAAGPSMSQLDVQIMIERAKRQIEEKSKIGLTAVNRNSNNNNNKNNNNNNNNNGNSVNHESAALAKKRELDARIASRFAAMSSTSVKEPAMPHGSIIMDSEGRLVDSSTGKRVQIASRATLKANIRAEEEAAAAAEKAATGAEEDKITTHNPYFDPRITNVGKATRRSGLQFNHKGKYEDQAHRMRSKAQLERLQEEISAAAKKSGISSATKLALMGPVGGVEIEPVPGIEWWDALVLPREAWFNEESFVARQEEGRYGDRVTHLVEHPIELEPPIEEVIVQPKAILTKKEQKKLRRQRRKEANDEVREKIRLELIPAPAPKMKLSNLMRVLGDEAIQEPSKIEQKVRQQMAAREAAGLAHNADRKLSKEERTAKWEKKLAADAESEIRVCVFRVRDLSDRKKRYKVQINAEEYKFTGCVVTQAGSQITLIVVEGGPKAIKKYKKLMLHRIKWDDGVHRVREGDRDDPDFWNECRLVWEGTALKRSFRDWRFKTFPTDGLCRDFLAQHNVAHYWHMALSQSIVEEAEEETR